MSTRLKPAAWRRLWFTSLNGWPNGVARSAAASAGFLLLTAHSAKGLEFDHVVVLDGDWNQPGGGNDADEQRRLYYVAMTRAKKTLALACFEKPNPFKKHCSTMAW